MGSKNEVKPPVQEFGGQEGRGFIFGKVQYMSHDLDDTHTIDLLTSFTDEERGTILQYNLIHESHSP